MTIIQDRPAANEITCPSWCDGDHEGDDMPPYCHGAYVGTAGVNIEQNGVAGPSPRVFLPGGNYSPSEARQLAADLIAAADLLAAVDIADAIESGRQRGVEWSAPAWATESDQTYASSVEHTLRLEAGDLCAYVEQSDAFEFEGGKSTIVRREPIVTVFNDDGRADYSKTMSIADARGYDGPGAKLVGELLQAYDAAVTA